jgi:uncharacterized protein YjbI with pentapeptide repeats
MITIVAKRAPVQPRVYLSESHEALPLEEVLRPFVETRTRGAIHLTGSPGAGKTTALAHLAARWPQPGPVLVGECPTAAELEVLAAEYLVVYTAPRPCRDQQLALLYLAPWGKDEVIEYLLAVHKDRCTSVMARLQVERVPLVCDSPCVWRVVLDQMAAEEALPDARTALLRHIRTSLADDRLFHELEEHCLSAGVKGLQAAKKTRRLTEALAQNGLSTLLLPPVVSLHLAVDLMVRELREGSKCKFLYQQLRRELIKTAAPVICSDERVQRALHSFLAGDCKRHPMTASLLHQAGTGWVPGATRNLAGAYLDGAAWPDVDLSQANLNCASLARSYLCRANLDHAAAQSTNFSRARLDGATLSGMTAHRAEFLQANLCAVQAAEAQFTGTNFTAAELEDAHLERCNFQSADLGRANLRGANLQRADLTAASIAGADFSSADLTRARLSGLRLREATFTGACFAAARLECCDLEYLDLPGVSFAGADLSEALLTGCQMPEADFTGACLRRAGLADINWEGACLRDADLRGASFHLGSARSGLLFTPYPCEGSKMGFYTDDAEEQHFKAPEEIRKANLCRADLRGARLDDVDFYLVDLRDALFDPQQEAVLRRCGAILEDPC